MNVQVRNAKGTWFLVDCTERGADLEGWVLLEQLDLEKVRKLREGLEIVEGRLLGRENGREGA